MSGLVINNANISDKEAFVRFCPFNALSLENGQVTVGAGCRLCGLCVKRSKNGEAVIVKDEAPALDKSEWRGIAVFVDREAGEIHPATYEMIGKARELADKLSQPVYAVFIGNSIESEAASLLEYPVNKVFCYDCPELENFRIEPYAAVFEDFIHKMKPCAILIAATVVGRQLAPRVAARFNTGLTADCTILDIEENSDLVQIRPAFGGNIMAEIYTRNSRPQMATVRYKVMDSAKKCAPFGELVKCDIAPDKLRSGIEILKVSPKEKVKTIEAADIIVAAGRGIRTKEDLSLCEELASALGGELACTRPLVEAGWVDARRQIGLSGRTVRPKLIITCGISGSVQFAAGMKGSDMIIAINSDEKAPIFNIANYGIAGDLYKVIPSLLALIKARKGESI